MPKIAINDGHITPGQFVFWVYKKNQQGQPAATQEVRVLYQDGYGALVVDRYTHNSHTANLQDLYLCNPCT
jgi:hypothetical protein